MKKLSDFKALLFDIDRTLTDTKREISPEIVAALNELSKKGFQTGVCSGRGTAAIKNNILPLFPKTSFHITTGGSQLIDSKGNIIWAHSIPSKNTEELRKYLDDRKMMAVFMKSDAQYTKEPILSKLKDHAWSIVAKDLSEMESDGVGSIYIPNLNDELINYIKNNNDLSFKYMTDNFGNTYIDVTARGVNKSVTLKKWSEHTGIPTEKIIGFGDCQNDMEFIKDCGFGVAMGNATQELKNISDRVIGHTDDNSLAKYLIKIINGGNL